MAPPRMTEDDVGSYYLREDGTIWRLIAYSDKPTATLEQVDGATGPLAFQRAPRTNGVVGAQIFDGFRKLVPQEPS